MYVDYCRLNFVTKFDCISLPSLIEAIDEFAGATVFNNLEFAITFHQVSVKPSEVEKTAFITHVSFFKMQKMLSPFVMRRRRISG